MTWQIPLSEPEFPQKINRKLWFKMRNYQTALERCASICQLSSSVNRPAFKILTFDYELKNNVMLFASVKFCSPDLFRRLQLTKSIPRHSVFFSSTLLGIVFQICARVARLLNLQPIKSWVISARALSALACTCTGRSHVGN